MDSKLAKRKKRSMWCDGDAQVLIDLWAERAGDLRRAKRNGHVYQEISVQMDNKYSPEEVHTKIRNFTQKYRDEKKVMGPSGGSPSNWKFFNDVHRIIGSNAANSAEVVETFLYVNTSDTSCSESQPYPSPVSQSLPSPASQPLPSPGSPPSPLSPLDTSASSASGKKRNQLGEVIKIMKEQNELLKSCVQDSQLMSTQVVNAILEQTETSKQFLNLMKNLIDKI